MRALRLSDFKTKQKLSFGLGLLIAVCGLAFGGVTGLRTVSAADCDSNAIIYCGTGSASQFIAQVRTNDSKNGHHDLQAVYAHYGLEPASYDRFVKTARPAVLYSDGRLVVDNQVVAGTNTTTIGRNASAQGAGYFSLPIGGSTYYGNTSGATFAAGTNSIGAMAMFDAKGVLQFAVLTACGNPIGNTPTTPNYSCNTLQKTAQPGVLNGYNFSSSATAGNGATVDHVVYDFGDGSAPVTKTNPSTIVPHTYTKAGTFTSKVTVYVNLPGAQQATVVAAGDCLKVTTVVLPFYACTVLNSPVVDRTNKYLYSFSAAAVAKDGASVAKFFYDFGDGTSGTSTNKTTGAISHVYKKAGNYLIRATVYVDRVGESQDHVTSTKCLQKITVVSPFYSCLQLAGPFVDKSKYFVKLVATGKYGNGATLVSADFTFGDGAVAKAIKASGSTVSVDHTYAGAGNYNAAAVLHFSVNGSAVSAPTCKALISPTAPPTPECKPGVPVGDIRCSPCQYDSSLPSDSPNCVAPLPTTLPDTGAGNVIAIAAVVAVGGFLIYRQLLFRGHKAAFIAAERGTSPLPLGQPLDPETPLAGTPLATKVRKTFRRNRPY